MKFRRVPGNLADETVIQIAFLYDQYQGSADHSNLVFSAATTAIKQFLPRPAINSGRVLTL